MDAQAGSGLTADELVRYARHLTLAEFGIEGQQRLKGARVLVVGAGGLGSPAALYLAAAGVGTLVIVDSDTVEASNLQRQVLHDTASIGDAKTDSARRRLEALNPHVTVIAVAERMTSANARALVRNVDIVLDGSDNFPTRYLVNDACVLEGRPLVYGSILRFEGQLSVFAVKPGPCYRCLFSEPPPPELVPSCADAGVVGALPGIIGSLQALEAIKWITGIGQLTVGRLLIFDGLQMRWREMTVRRDPSCSVYGDHPVQTGQIDYEAFCGVASGPAVVESEIAPRTLADLLARGGEAVIIDVREPWEFEIARLPGSRSFPLRTLPARLAELPRGQELITVCHHGPRSLSARDLLVSAGFGPVRSLAGGVDAWATSIDPEMARY